MNRTEIPWADWSWNPVSGCTPVSEGCAHCYALAMARVVRFARRYASCSARYKPCSRSTESRGYR